MVGYDVVLSEFPVIKLPNLYWMLDYYSVTWGYVSSAGIEVKGIFASSVGAGTSLVFYDASDFSFFNSSPSFLETLSS